MNNSDFCVFRFLPEPEKPKPTQEPFSLSPTERALMNATNREIWQLYQEALHNHSNYEKTTETADLNPATCTAEAFVQAENNPLVATFWGGRCVIPVSEAHRRLHTYITGSAGSGKRQSTLDLEALIAQKKLIIFDLPKGKLGRNADIIGKMLVAQIKILAFKRNPAFSCHLFIDEMHNFITSSMLEILEECRKFRLHLTMAQQQFGQGVSESRIRNSIIGNTGVKLTGLNGDDSTLKALASSTGADVDELKKHLHRGVFSLWQAGLNAPPEPPKFISIPRTTLGNKQGMSDEQWKVVKNLQISRFYRRLNSTYFQPIQTLSS